MKLTELKKIVDATLESSHKEDFEVCIPNNKKGMVGGTPTTLVQIACAGFDWDKGKFMIFPENRMKEILNYDN